MPQLARSVVWPAVVTLSAAAFGLAFARGHAALSLVAVPPLAWILILLAERRLPLRDQDASWGDPQAPSDLFHAVVGQGIGNRLGEAVVAGTTVLGAGWLGDRFAPTLWPVDWPLAAQVPLGVLVADGLEYARHRAEHEWEWLWPVHALHHSIRRMNVLKAGRGHALDMVLRHVAVFLPLAVIGAPDVVLAAYVAAVNVLGPIGHANVDVRIPSAAHRLLLTPPVHRIHHAQDPTMALGNYAAVLPLWDMLFGTFVDPERVHPDAFGIADDPMPDSLWGQLVAPLAWWRPPARGGR